MSFHLLCILLYMRMRTIPRYCYRPHWRHSCESWWSTRRYLLRKWNRTRLKSHGDYIYLIVYIWSPVYVFFFYLRNKVGLTVSNVSFTLHRNCTFFHTNQIFSRATFFIFTRIGIGLHTKLVNPLTETASF